MTSGTLTPRKKLPRPTPSRRLARVRLHEDVAQGYRPLSAGSTRVDREQGIVRGVKLVGLTSKNHRRYTPEALQKAKPLYIGAPLNVDHPDKATDSRSAHDRIGKILAVELHDDGLYGDIQLLKTHPLYERVMEAAERMEDAYAFSHNADGNGHTEDDGTFVCTAVVEVRSVDLVADGATNRSLFESHTMQTTLRQLIEASKAKPLFKRLLEMPEDEMPPLDMPMDAPPEAPVEGDWKADLVAAIGKLVSSENEEDHKLAQKVMSMLKPQAVAPEIVTEEEEEDEDEEETPVAESRKRKATPDTITLTEAKSLCKLVGLAEDAGLLGMLDGAPREKGMSLLEWAKGKAVPSKGVRSQGAGGVDTTTTPKFPTSPDERRKLLAAV